ncbi:MAG: SDR family NAD(P)-dependent oxidoreductase [Selenomonadaceae bacterium]|nr:SDR family NAD(P)-dependent oxidoreductase [Selenomonadaceae bacterium]
MSTIFITGANKGIGFALAEELLKKNFRVIVGARDLKRGSDAVKILSTFGEVHLQLIDVADLESIRRAAQDVAKNFGDLTMLINNAGIAGDMHKTAWDFSAQELIEVYMTDFIGAFELTKNLLPLLEKNHGRIVNITMPTNATEFFHPLAYQAAKAPMNIMIDNFGFEFAQKKMSAQIFGLMPGVVSTDLNNHIQGAHVKSPSQSAKQMTEIILDNRNLNGQIIDVDKF